jgi:hypothetical protein
MNSRDGSTNRACRVAGNLSLLTFAERLLTIAVRLLPFSNAAAYGIAAPDRIFTGRQVFEGEEAIVMR